MQIFVLISIEIGKRFDLWDQDWKIPLQYGIKNKYTEKMVVQEDFFTH